MAFLRFFINAFILRLKIIIATAASTSAIPPNISGRRDLGEYRTQNVLSVPVISSLIYFPRSLDETSFHEPSPSLCHTVALRLSLLISLIGTIDIPLTSLPLRLILYTRVYSSRFGSTTGVSGDWSIVSAALSSNLPSASPRASSPSSSFSFDSRVVIHGLYSALSSTSRITVSSGKSGHTPYPSSFDGISGRRISETLVLYSTSVSFKTVPSATNLILKLINRLGIPLILTSSSYVIGSA